MTIPSSSHPIWSELVTGRLHHTLNFLAAKILLARLNRVVQLDPSSSAINKCINELRDLYAAYPDLPKVKKDMQLIFGA